MLLHQAPWSGQVAAILGCARVASLRRAELEGEKSLERPRKGARKERKRPQHTKSDDEFNFGSVEEAEGGSVEMSESGHKGSSQKKESKAVNHGGDEAIKGKKTEDELETANSDESENRSEEAESVQVFDSDTLSQPRAKRKRRQ